MSIKGLWLIDTLFFCRDIRGSYRKYIPIFAFANHIERHFSESTNNKTKANLRKQQKGGAI